MEKIVIAILISISLGQVALAQSLVPATSDDLAAFDQQISQNDKNKASTPAPQKVPQASESRTKKAKRSNFGATVSQHAKDLKKEDSEQKNNMGQWVSEQRANESSTGKGQDASGSGSDISSGSSSSAKEARTSSPASSSGRSGERKK